MANIKEWELGETIRISNSYTDIDDAPYDPTSISLKIYDPTGALDTTVTYALGDIQKSSTGEYYYDYDIKLDATTGWWITKWTGVAGSFSDVTKGQFRAVDPEDKLYTTVENAYNICGMESTVADHDEVVDYIRNAMSHIDSMYQKNFQYSNDITEWFDTDQPDENVKVKAIFLNYTPVRSVTSVKEYDTDGTEVDSHTGSDYTLHKKTGRIKLRTEEFGHQADRVEVVYKYGHDTIPDKVSMLCAIMTGQSILLKFAGASYDDVVNYNACGISVGIGEPYMNATKTYELLQKTKDKLIAEIGRLRPSIFIV